VGDAVASSKNRWLQELAEQNARLRGQLALLSRIGRRLSSSLDVRIVLQETVEAACEIDAPQ